MSQEINTLKLVAGSNVSVTENREEEYYMASMAGDAHEPEHYIIFQRSFETDEQDAELGLAGCYFEVDSQEYAGYAVCKQVVLSRSELVVNISRKNKRLYSYTSQINISFSIPKGKFLDLVKMMKTLFQDDTSILVLT